MKSINFEFLRDTYPELADLAGFAENYAHTDQTSCLVKLRTFAEFLVKAVFSRNHIATDIRNNLNDLLNDPSFKRITPPVVQDKLHLIRIKGNHAAHGSLHKLTTEETVDMLKEANGLARWLLVSTGQVTVGTLPKWQEIPASSIESKAELKREKKAALQKLADQEVLMQKLLTDLEEARSQAEAEQKTEAETQAILNEAQQAANALDFSEETTRFKLIDEQLIAAGWKVGARGQSNNEVGQEVKVLHQPTASGIGYIDYVLYDEDGMPMAVVEAKKTAESADRGKQQARYYADGLEKMTGHRPVIFYTNGFEIFIWNDAKKEPPRPLFGFYSRDSLQYDIFQRLQRDKKLSALIPRESITDRLYQIEAIKRVSENFDKRKRKALIIQATGTGKTRVAISLCDVMIRAKWAKRILFLCDRRELRKQAQQNFVEHLPNAPSVIVNSRTATDRNQRIYLSTYPAMMKCFSNFDVGFFDLVIADESHRSIYNRYRDIFRYFDAFQVGLTATPVKFVFRNTYKLFECEDGDPTVNYPYEDAITHEPPYLCPFKVVKHTTKFLREGVKFNDLTPEQQEQLTDEVGDGAEAVDFEGKDMSKKVHVQDTDKSILHNLMVNGIKNEAGTNIGKTIIFARNHPHAKLLVETFDKEFPQYGGTFCARIDNYEPRAEQLIDDFKSTDSSSDLTIAVSVDMLDTGIDVPEIVNLVFAKPVKSYAKFWQMIGRGTRLCEDLFGPGQDKEYFQIFDHWGNFEYFDELTKEVDPSTSKSLMEQLFESRITLAQTAVDTQNADTLKLATSLLGADIASLPSDCLCVREKLREVKQVQVPEVLEQVHPATMATLRQEIAPLMKWRNSRGLEAAYQFDLLISKLQTDKLTGAATAENHKDFIINQVSALPINLKQVMEKNEYIQLAKSSSFLDKATTKDLEKIRTELRGIMKYRKKTSTPSPGPLVLKDISDGGEEYKIHTPRLLGLDLVAYRNRVESVLQKLLDSSSALQKIQTGESVTDEELDELVKDVVLQDPDIKIEDLLTHYPNDAQNLARAIRSIIGLDAAKVDEHFKSFVQAHPSITANQTRFLDMLKGHIKRYGAIEIDKLWEDPFTQINTNGVDGIFKDDQVDDLLQLINEINGEVA
ncbi:DEAD/DEAH box helicase family protein [Verrucomicrobiaceae bacterium R5-34]|nr:DEAD/DEAH box helicase family protein [Verrucomicrobiaceae bacterium R5-34]